MTNYAAVIKTSSLGQKDVHEGFDQSGFMTVSTHIFDCKMFCMLMPTFMPPKIQVQQSVFPLTQQLLKAINHSNLQAGQLHLDVGLERSTPLNEPKNRILTNVWTITVDTKKITCHYRFCFQKCSYCIVHIEYRYTQYTICSWKLIICLISLHSDQYVQSSIFTEMQISASQMT